jgi:hypothetical protein
LPKASKFHIFSASSQKEGKTMRAVSKFRLSIAIAMAAVCFGAVADTNVRSPDEPADATPQGTPNPATRTIFLDTDGTGVSVASPVAYDPSFNLYYASGTGNTSTTGFVFDSAGGVPSSTVQPLNIDPRSWVFNANTAQLEVVSFSAVSGGTDRGLIQPGVDASGNLTGATMQLLASMPGLNGSQTAPAYDAVDDVFYSRANSNGVNVVDRADGSLNGTIALDFTGAGISSVPDDGIVYVPSADLLGVVDTATDLAVFFNTDGTFASASQLDIDVTSGSRRPGFANGQLFVFDDSRGGWQGFDLALGGPAAPTLAVPTLDQYGRLALIVAMIMLAGWIVRRQA